MPAVLSRDLRKVRRRLKPKFLKRLSPPAALLTVASSPDRQPDELDTLIADLGPAFDECCDTSNTTSVFPPAITLGPYVESSDSDDAECWYQALRSPRA